MTARPLSAVDERLLGGGQRSAILLTVVLAVVALALGFLLRLAVESRTTSVSLGGVSASVPAGWVVTPGVGDRAFSAFDPRSPDTTFGASLVPGSDAEGAARAQLGQDHALRDGFTELDAFPVRLDGREGYQIEYAFVESGTEGGLPVTLRGVVHFLVDGDVVIGLNYVAPADTFADKLDRFFRFAGSARAAP